ncbi:pyridoxamine 5'-phosphate oxidase family protein [Streptomyces pinistramenti]|uniref:pyridoxamine 5'-phosphate oxidase family protein n=1 Tax=Streptomyces pinistramenti TaxID=2884812 RepID=UPI001D0994A4|nr:pyridoxamine 5'-phosphate oxidase family protein [Streptomyces pinistramenti]MCB5907188.1 pyridoxamine 5'-phosphate oxidase family protein [Streptomyces pinistramenti]
MTQHPPARNAEQRKRDVLKRLETDIDAWVSTAAADGTPCLVPLSFVWHQGRLVMSTRAANPTARNLMAGGECRIAVGHTRDVVLLTGTAEAVTSDVLADGAGKAFAAKLAWDPRGKDPWIFLSFRPRQIMAWREQNELADRELMRDGHWLV